MNKLLRFLLHLQALPTGDRTGFTQKMNDDPKFRRRVGEKLVLLVDKLDDLDKAEMVARCFDHFLSSDITYDEFCEFAQLIDRSLIQSAAARGQREAVTVG